MSTLYTFGRLVKAVGRANQGTPPTTDHTPLASQDGELTPDTPTMGWLSGATSPTSHVACRHRRHVADPRGHSRPPWHPPGISGRNAARPDPGHPAANQWCSSLPVVTSRCRSSLPAAGRHFPLPVVTSLLPVATSRCRSRLPAAGRDSRCRSRLPAAGRDFPLPVATSRCRSCSSLPVATSCCRSFSSPAQLLRHRERTAAGSQEAQQEVRRRSKNSATAATSTASAPSRQQEVRRRSKKSGGAARSQEAQRQPGRHSGNPGASAFKLDNPRAPPTANYPATGAHSGPVSPSFSSSFAKIGLGLDSGVPATIGRDSHTACSEA